MLGLDEATAIVGHNMEFEVFGQGTASIVTDAVTTSYPRGARIEADLLAGGRHRLASHIHPLTFVLLGIFRNFRARIAYTSARGQRIQKRMRGCGARTTDSTTDSI